MKKNFLLVACSFVLIFSCTKNNTPTPSESQSDVNLKNGLLVYLPFDGNFADSSGNGNQTAASGGAILTYDEHGIANSAFGGTGSGERILVTNNGSIKFDTAFSISADVMIRNIQNQAIVTMEDNTDAEGVSFGFGMGIPGNYNVDMAVSNSSYTCSDLISASNSVIDTSQFIMQPESWYNMITIFHKGTIQIFANGKLISTKTGASTTVPICPSAKLVIAGWWDGDPESLNGKLDEFRLYNRVLNADEIAQLSNNFQ